MDQDKSRGWVSVVVVLLIVGVLFGVLWVRSGKNSQTLNSEVKRNDNGSVTVSGLFELTDGFVLSPSGKPTNPKAG